MKKFEHVLIAAVLVAGALLVSGVAEADPSAQKVCVNKATGAMRYLYNPADQTCKKSEIRWQVTVGELGSK